MCKVLSIDDVGVSRDTVFQEIRPGAGFETGDFVKENDSGSPYVIMKLSFPYLPTNAFSRVCVRRLRDECRHKDSTIFAHARSHGHTSRPQGGVLNLARAGEGAKQLESARWKIADVGRVIAELYSQATTLVVSYETSNALQTSSRKLRISRRGKMCALFGALCHAALRSSAAVASSASKRESK